jgi:type II secretory ATPase GspE/PulE/Tfp pilus assembly ATPase PilB-like protein
VEKQVQKLVAVLERVPFLRSCTSEDLNVLARSTEHRRHEARDILVEAGRPVTFVGVLLQGKASVLVVDAAQGTQQQIERLRPGDMFGDTAFLLGTATPVAVIAETEGQTLAIEAKAFEKVFIKTPELILALAHRAATRFVRVSMLGTRQTEAAPPLSPAPAPKSGKEKAVRDDDAVVWVDPASYELGPEIIGTVPIELIRKHRLLPLQIKGRTLVVGMVNPTSVEARQELQRVLHSSDPEIVAISADDFSQAYVSLRLGIDDARGKTKEGARSGQLVFATDVEKKTEKSQVVIGSEVIALFDRIVLDGIERGASDVHIEPDANGVTVRYRVQGALYTRKEFISPGFAPAIMTRIKVLAELDITDRRLPQDGRILVRLGNQELNLRVSTMVVARGEKAVIRIIDSADAQRSLRQVFANPALEKTARSALAQPHGAIVVAGPTGSGKSSTLYAMLNERRMARKDTNIVTVEDPVEYLLQGVSQVPINPRVGFGFSAALRGLMRQDPDVIMIGELRDQDTTSMMVEAALTGHLVLTSIHGNTAAAVIKRLEHLGAEPVLLSQAVSLIVVQRLARKLCASCAVDAEVSPTLLENLVARKVVAGGAAVKLPRPVGCKACEGTGFAGRVAVQELLVFDDAVRGALADGATPAVVMERARERGSFTSFAESAAYLMARRILSPTDALLVVAE